MWKSLLSHVKDMLSGRFGTVSTARVLMTLFSLVSSGILIGVFRHMTRLTDATLLGIWIGGLPAIGGILIALVAAPYTINKGAGAITDIVSSIATASSAPKTLATEINATSRGTTVTSTVSSDADCADRG